MNVTLQVGVKVLLKNKENKYLLLRRSLVKYPGVNDRWDIVGGRIDPGTVLIDNLKREIKEEANLTMTSEPKLIAAQDIIPNQEKHIVRLTYIAEIDGDPVLNMEEHDSYKWFTFKELTELADLDHYFKELLPLIK